MPLFSVIIPTFNRADLIGQAIESVLQQEMTDYEIIVVDDGSTDSTLEVLRRFGDRVCVHRQANAGPGAARNTGIERARGKYVVFLDSDDRWFPWTLSTYYTIIEKTLGPVIVMGSALYWSEQDDLSKVRYTNPQFEIYPDYFATSRASFLRTACVLAVQTEQIRAAGGFASKRINSEDHDLLYRMGTARGFVRIVSPHTVAYRQHPSSISNEMIRTYRGIIHQLEQEREGKYPGGRDRRAERIRLLSFGARVISWGLLHTRQFRESWDLYRQAIGLQLRNKPAYVVAFPLYFFLTRLGIPIRRG